MDVIRDKNLVKPKGNKRRDRHKIIFCESNQRRQSQRVCPQGSHAAADC